MNKKINARDIAYKALCSSEKGECYLQDFLNTCDKDNKICSRDFAFARELCYGVERRKLTLDYIAKSLSTKGKLKLKLKERILVRMSMYQHFFMDKVPDFAIANEMLELAKKYCHHHFSKFLNALIRNLPQDLPTLPNSNCIHDLSITYSYPQYYIESIVNDYGMEKAIALLKLGNIPSQTFIRLRQNANTPEGCDRFSKQKPAMAILKNKKSLMSIIHSSHYYVQNITPATLIETLCENVNTPQKILDLCASPGGKTLAIHDIFPKAELHANDISEQKLEILKSNFKKYSLNVHIHSSPGQHFKSKDQFDIVIVDAPCSNSGVLNKRPEARWRLNENAIAECTKTQKALIKNGLTLLREGGQLWFMTCSILKAENENLIEEISQKYGLSIKSMKTIFPTKDGWDGGFAAALTREALAKIHKKKFPC